MLSLRLTTIITRLLTGERLKVGDLASEFGVSERTIRQDLNVRLAELYVVCKDGFYFLETMPKIKDYELLNFSKRSGILGLYPNLNSEILNSNETKTTGFKYENIDKTLFENLEKSIKDKISLNFNYKNKFRKINPYKLLNLNGIWYLIGTEEECIKNFSVAKISDLKFGENFKIEPKFLDLIQNSDTFITENLITIKLKVDKKVAYYIKRREIFPN